MDSLSLAERYHHDVSVASSANLSAEPEAQLTTPVSNLFRAIAREAGLGEIDLVREQRTGRTRPDFGVLQKVGHRQFQRGYIELKAPHVSVDTSQWKNRNDRQWRQMAVEAEVLLVCNGRHARLYVNGQSDGLDVALPYDTYLGWDNQPLANLLRRFLSAQVSPVKSITELSTRLAYRTADLRDKLLWLLEQKSPAGEMAWAQYEGWKRAIHVESSPRDFADGISQVVSYGMVLAALSGVEADANHDGVISIEEARAAIKGISPVMSAAFGPLLESPLFEAVQIELGHLESLISAIDTKRVQKSSDRRGEPWLYFYEDFLGIYDPEERRQAGVYYTPTSVVKAMVSIVDHLLVERFEVRSGFADPSVVTLDPAVGTGTFPLAVLDRAAERMEKLRGAASQRQVAANLSNNLYGFELLPGPYAVSHLRLTQRLRELDDTKQHVAKIMLTDTLESPDGIQEQISLFGDGRILAEEQNRAKKVKAKQPVTVVIGNPPYRRLAKDVHGRGSGGWILEPIKRGRKTKSLFDDILDVAKKHTIFSHHASLYNLYVYFWRWAIWKAFEAHDSQRGIVAFITGSSWLTGPGFMGLRQMVREICDEAWVIDLGGDNKGANPEENVFAIETPVAIVVLVRREHERRDKKARAKIQYRRIKGTSEEKLNQLEVMAESTEPLNGDWEDVPSGLLERMVPTTGNAEWNGYPKLADLFPWQQAACKFGRTWPIATRRETLVARWQRFTSGTKDERPTLFKTAKTGRNINTQVGEMTRLVDEVEGAQHQPIMRYGYRSFDRQWAFDDPRLANRESPSLWQSVSENQVFFASMMTNKLSPGPALTVTEAVPDLHYFCGRGGKDIIPLYRDAEALKPNVTKGLLAKLGKQLEMAAPSPEDLAAYVYALLSCPEYQARFEDALKTPGPRVPLTKDRMLWEEAVRLGAELIWLHTYAERFRGPRRGKFVPLVDGLGWKKSITVMPETLKDICYEEESQCLVVGDGVVEGVLPEVWEFTVSGMDVVKKWLGYRTANGTGRAASSTNPLDQIRPKSWPDDWNDELLDLLRVLTLTVQKYQQQEELLRNICEGPTISADELPTPTAKQRKTPATLDRTDNTSQTKMEV